MTMKKSLWARLTFGQPRLVVILFAFLAAFLYLPQIESLHAQNTGPVAGATSGPRIGLGGPLDTPTFHGGTFTPFGFLSDPNFTQTERVALFIVLAISI